MKHRLWGLGAALAATVATAAIAKSHPPLACIVWQANALLPPLVMHEVQTRTGGFDNSENAKLQEAIQATKDVIRHPTFLHRLSAASNAYNHIQPSPTPLGGLALLSLYEANGRCVSYVKDSFFKNETAHTDYFPTGCLVTHLKVSSVVNRWHGTDTAGMVSRACVINTLAHEWSHTLVQQDGEELITDDGHEESPYPLASYTLGAIAQCSFLLDNNIITAPHFEACVDGAGARDFYANTCELAWVTSLESGTARANCSSSP